MCRNEEKQVVKKAKKARIITCAVILGIGCIVGGCVRSNMRKREEREQRAEIVAGYPDKIEAYLEEKYGREFCVSPNHESMDNGPVPFAPSYYAPYEYLAWEDEEDGYAFWTNVYPKSLDNKEIKEIRDNYCWKFIGEKIKKELEARLEGIIDEYRIIAYPFHSDFMFFGENANQDSGIKEALLDNEKIDIIIQVFISPEIRFDRESSLPEIEKIVKGFYNDYFQADSQVLDFYIHETYTEEDYLKIEPEKTEQYSLNVKESEYEGGASVPVDYKTIMQISIIRGEEIIK